jgi:hypothetical protein
MAEPITSYIVDNDNDFKKALDRLKATTSDFRIPFGLIAREFYKSNRKIFKLKKAGKYPVLGGINPSAIKQGTQTNREFAETQKERQVGFIYPLLVREGLLAASLVKSGHSNALKKVTKDSLLLGTSVEYAKYLQEGTKFMKARKVVFIDGGPLETSKGASSSGRREQWLNIINTYIVDKINEAEL